MKFLLSVALSVALSVPAVLGLVTVVPSAEAERFTELRQATWQIDVGGMGHCSGTFIKPKIMLTAAHCFNDNLLVDGVKAVVLKKDEKLDLMLLFVDKDSPVVALAVPMDVEQDMKVVVVGYPGNMPQYLTEGRVQGTLVYEDRIWTAISAPVWFGNSGGGVFVKIKGEWKLVGVLSAMQAHPFAPGPSHLALMTDSYHTFLFVE